MFVDGGTVVQHSFFDIENRLQSISQLDDPLERRFLGRNFVPY